MNLKRESRLHRMILVVLAAQLAGATAVTFTNDTIISAADTSYDGLDVTVSNCTVAVDGPHAFASLLVAGGGTLTHSFWPGGSLTNFLSVTNELQALADTNVVTLLNSNILTATIRVTDTNATITYTNDLDYVLSDLGGGLTGLQRTTNSTIPDGTNVWVSYDAVLKIWSAGVNLTVTGDVHVAAGGAINANGKGYAGNTGPGNGGEAGNPLSGAGAGYGGLGGMSSSNAVGGTTYGSFEQPTNLGSGGGAGAAGVGGAGGGAIKIVAGGVVINNGTISASGADGTNSRSGGGSGGSVWITAYNLIGSGTINANGGAGEPIHGGGGGGGRIAIQCDANNFSGSTTTFGGFGAKIGGAGTIFTKLTGQNGLLLLDNGGRAGTNSLLAITSGADVLVRGNASAVPSGAWTVGNLTIATNGLLTIAYPSTINLTATGSVTIQAGGSVLADAAGYAAGQGNGSGRSFNDNASRPCGGAGHGGSGANGFVINASGGITYGSQTSPNSFGSGGGALAGAVSPSVSGPGGGVIRLTVNGILLVDGRISANGGNGSGTGGGGGSGGSVWLTVETLAGSGSITANGGNGVGAIGGGGGGGRIAIYLGTNLASGAVTAYGGSGANWGGAGTVFIQPTGQNSQFILDNAGHSGTNTPLQSASATDLTVRNGAIGYASSTLSFANLLVGSNAWLASYSQSQPITVNLSFSGNATIQAGGGIMADAAGYPVGQGSGAGRYNPDTRTGSGAGHGGYGGNGAGINTVGGNAYDYTASPTSAGSGGGTYSSYSIGGPGGGAVRLTVNGALQLDGRISANGGNGSGGGGGGGSGGSVWLTAGTLSGSGSITANGGSGVDLAGGGGGGGRISISYNTSAFTGTIWAYGGGGANWGGAGTIYLTSRQSHYLILDNGGNAGTNTTFDVSRIDLTVSGKAVGQLPSGGGSVGNLLVRSNSVLTTIASSAVQNVTVTGNATVEDGGSLSVDGKGNSGGQGTGAGSTYSGSIKGGAGHGGFGAANPTGYGGAYGSIQSPTLAGSGGGNGSGTMAAPYGGAGGGALRLTVTSNLTVNGRLSSNGRDGDANSGGGSGGSLYITTGTLTGSGVISANGGSGNGSGGGGGGGRVSVAYSANTFSGLMSACGGGGYGRGGAGTVYTERTKATSQSVGQLLVDNSGFPGTNTPLSSAYSMPTSPFNLTINGGAVVYPQAAFPLLSNVNIGPGSVLTCSSGQSNLVLAVLGNVNIASGGAIWADGKGFAQTNGPGAGSSLSSKGSGGGYGGAGGASASGAVGGTNYGSATQPVDRGSGGGAGYGPFVGGSDGGGAVRLSVGGVLIVDGTLSANGNRGLQDDSGGGAGGSLWVTAGALAGDGLILADGGSGDLYGGGGGGGGRIAICTPINAFTGFGSAVGGDGAVRGEDGTVLFSPTLPDFQVRSHSPAGLVSNTVSYVDLNFSEVVSPGSVSASDFTLFTPNGPLTNLTTAMSGLTTVRLSFPQQNLVGDYRIEAGPAIADLFGQPMSQVYTGAFTVVLPTISGTVTATNGLPVAGVVLQPYGGLLGVATDTNGNYALGVPPGWNGRVMPALDSFVFVPSARSYTNILESVTNENYLMVETVAPPLDSGLNGTNLWLNWPGIQGVSYRAWWSTNLTEWFPLGDAVAGTNGLMELLLPLDEQPMHFFRLRATY